MCVLDITKVPRKVSSGRLCGPGTQTTYQSVLYLQKLQKMNRILGNEVLRTQTILQYHMVRVARVKSYTVK